ncbi:MAG: hypothetical protein IJG39_10215 [Synergistaceae bacterium]|nr:hypothetical protein [Synergistaceae bacterium]
MSFSLVKKFFLNAYAEIEDWDGNTSTVCYPIGEAVSGSVDSSKVSAVIQALIPCLNDFINRYNFNVYQEKVLGFSAVNLVEGYKFEFTPDTISPYIEDFNCGWVGSGNGVWTYEYPTQCYSDIYRVEAGVEYWLTLGDTVGTRFRVMFSTADISNVTSGTVAGVAVNKSNYNNQAPHLCLSYTPSSDGFLIIQKDNDGTSGIKTFLYYADDLV